MLALHVRASDRRFRIRRRTPWQRYYEQAQIGGSHAHAALAPVDGGGFHVEFLTDVQRKAIAKLTYCRAILGETGNAIVTLVLGANMPIQQAALARGMVTRREIEYVGQRFRESLSDLARVFGYA